MTMHIHHLLGCAPEPLALYLKAIGILRLVSEQADPTIRGWWQDEHFCVASKLDRVALETFFLERYSPSPLLSPWNKGSGFYKQNDPGLSPIEASTASRFSEFRRGVSDARRLIDAIGRADATIRAIKARTKTNKDFQSPEQRELLRASEAFRRTVSLLRSELKRSGLSEADSRNIQQVLEQVEKIASEPQGRPTKAEADALKNEIGYKRLLREAEKEFKRLKELLLPDCRRQWRGHHARWMSAGIVLDQDGNPHFASLLGTGGNDGNFDFTNNFMIRLGDLFDLSSEDGQPRVGSGELLRQSFWGEDSNRLDRGAIGQFLPGNGGGANSSTGPSGGSLINPWDFVLMLEGALPFSARVTRRLDHVSGIKASAPFAMYSHGVGYASPGAEKDLRGEQWLPIWSRPATMGDLSAMLGDARLQVGRQTANRPVDAARAVARLGTARGITAFERYGFLERNGQSTLAVPLGRIRVQHRPRAALIDDIAEWMNTLQRLARDSNAPARLVHAERRLADAVFAVLAHDDTAQRWQAVLVAAVEIENLQRGGTALRAGPIPRLQSAWIQAIDDNSTEIRLALALGSAAANHSADGRLINDPIRHHWLPLQRGARRFEMSEQRLVNDPRIVIDGRNPIADLYSVVARRLLEAESGSQRLLPLKAARGCAASLPDVAEFISGRVDGARVLALGRALMALDWHAWYRDRGWEHLRKPTSFAETPDDAWLAVRLACLPWPVDDAVSIPAEAAMVSRLISGDATSAVGIAARRLGSAGIHVPFSSAFADADTARRWAAALAFPIARPSARRAVELLVPDFFGVAHA